MHTLNISNNLNRQDEILSNDALAFLCAMVEKFTPERDRLLGLRETRQQTLNDGVLPGFCSETQHITDADWQVAPIPAEAQDRRTEITGPVSRKMVINAVTISWRRASAPRRSAAAGRSDAVGPIDSVSTGIVATSGGTGGGASGGTACFLVFASATPTVSTARVRAANRVLPVQLPRAINRRSRNRLAPCISVLPPMRSTLAKGRKGRALHLMLSNLSGMSDTCQAIPRADVARNAGQRVPGRKNRKSPTSTPY